MGERRERERVWKHAREHYRGKRDLHQRQKRPTKGVEARAGAHETESVGV